MRPAHPYLDTPWPIAFAHRGGAGDGVENALSSFAEVQRLGYRYVETDVRTTADGIPVIFHDEDAGRLTGDPLRIGDLRLAEVSALALHGGERIATLEQALDAFPYLRFNIDLKDWPSVHSVPAVLQRSGAAHRVCLTSFSERRVRAMRLAAGTAVCTGLGVGGVLTFLGAAAVQLPWRGAAEVLQLPWELPGRHSLPAWIVRAGHRHGLAVHVWTVDDPVQMTAALDLGVDGIMTDRPAVLKDVLSSRGLWPT